MFAGNETEAAAQLQADLDSTAAAIHDKAHPNAAENTTTTRSDESEKNLPAVGEVYIVGAGPGDPELLTFKALRLMQQADIVYYDALVSPQVLDLCRRDADKVFVGKKRSNHTVAQLGINELLVNSAKEGRLVYASKVATRLSLGVAAKRLKACEHMVFLIKSYRGSPLPMPLLAMLAFP